MPHLMDNGADSHRLRPFRAPEFRGAEIIAQRPVIETGVNDLLVLAGPYIGMMRPNGIRSGPAGLVKTGINEQYQVQDAVAVGIVGGKIYFLLQLTAGFRKRQLRGCIPQPLPFLHYVLAIGCHGLFQQHRPVNVENRAE